MGVMRVRHTILIIAAAVLVAAAARAGDTIEIRPEAYVKGPVVRLGDVARIQGDNMEALAAVELVPAPRPGQSATVLAALIEAKLHNQGFDTEHLSIGGSKTVRATTSSLQVTDGMVRESLREFIMMNMPHDAIDTTVDMMVPSFTVTVPDGEVAFDWRPSAGFNYLGNGAFRGEILVDGVPVKTLACRARIEAYGDIVITATDIPRGAVIGPRDVTLEQRPLSTLARGVVTDPGDVIGQVARRTLFPDMPLLRRDVVSRTLVKRNQMVSVEARAGSLRVRTTAKAMADGGEGDDIPLVNPDTKQQFYGTVGPDGVIRIPMGG
jgi:flagellar basal body P-ring formation protein FlgA